MDERVQPGEEREICQQLPEFLRGRSNTSRAAALRWHLPLNRIAEKILRKWPSVTLNSKRTVTRILSEARNAQRDISGIREESMRHAWVVFIITSRHQVHCCENYRRVWCGKRLGLIRVIYCYSLADAKWEA